MFSKYAQLLCFYYIVFIVVWNRHVVSFSDIRSLPGFSASLPFKLETGYIGVGDLEFFYYFIQSERDPSKDPLILWLTGGPGCSALSGLFFEIGKISDYFWCLVSPTGDSIVTCNDVNLGPLQFNMVEHNGSLPTFALNPYSWTKVANIIFLDAPVGTGFSYSTTLQGFETGDKRFANDGYNFLRKWLQSHPKFITNSLYIAGDSYAGKIVPIIVHAISDGIEDENFPAFNLKGYLVGNPATGSKYDDNSKIPFYNRMALISDELYESAKRNCKEEYVEVEMSNVICAKDLQAISECIAHINKPHILEPECPSDFDPPDSSVNERKYFLETREEDCLQAPAEYPKFGCRNYNTYLCKIWASDDSVQQALGIRKGTIREWIRCNESLLYDKDVGSVLDYHLSLNTKGYRALIYSGDHDRLVPYVGTESWIKSLNLSIVDDWRPWFVDDQVAGYSREYGNNLTFATVKGGGHTAPEFKPKECFAMFNRWISKKSL
ncbi:serine carboxypeptidase-like 18 isoform X2 [Gossypium arboreum]|uniref:serine carboxypeptidase-like 18 isoform X2 n=1 Tax=Gossypium arboreum TaxID=29729 RepID=UPI0022F1CF1A|nr:serine carboxypeptidase-like 18 isoform X2 [Gossypium arboreum]